VVRLASYADDAGMPISSPRHADDPVLVALGAAIRRCRRVQGVSQEELAHRSAIDRSYMSSIERGGQNPGVLSIVRIARAMDMTMTELMAEAEL
jgi:transcriptional regulator with XRE-family HTH domain